MSRYRTGRQANCRNAQEDRTTAKISKGGCRRKRNVVRVIFKKAGARLRVHNLGQARVVRHHANTRTTGVSQVPNNGPRLNSSGM